MARQDSGERPVSEFAESALLLAAISPLLLGLTAMLAIPVAIAGLVEVRRSRGRLRGTGRCIAALVISVVVIVAALALAAYLYQFPLPWKCLECVPPQTSMLDVQAGPSAAMRSPTEEVRADAVRSLGRVG